MPIYLRNKIVFIHIPKTGGSSIEKTFEDKKDESIFRSEEYIINNHSPQHSTYEELVSWNLIPKKFKIIATIRHPYERFISEYNYKYTELVEPLKVFAEMFLGKYSHEYDWDNHDLPCYEFIKGCENIQLMKFHTFPQEFEKITKLKILRHELKGSNVVSLKDLTKNIKELIYDKWNIDFIKFGYER